MEQPKKIKVKKDIELTKKYTDAQEKFKNTVKKSEPNSAVVNDKTQGITIDKSSLKATPKKMVRNVDNSGGYKKITGADGKVIFRDRINTQASKDAQAASDRKVASTDKSREYNANFVNNNYAGKENRTDADNAQLLALQKAKKK